ncbi:hypothetical protein [Litoreibacter roseus]|uniref:Uncharacterized protein n=1 Tax=Litoreibacter roseus TaxID=2601869 RepID=A0A6N6JBG7_9RHOB|nr:hypothetical protein [Litoreibacter roseus]GFE63515.1 hypothetical protein KIN_05890 [Litoreibacter roseus]
MPDHIKFMLRHAGFGACAALGFVGLLLYFNVGNLWYLVSHSAGGFLALAVMTVFFIITFGSVQIGIAIMGLADPEQKDPPRGKLQPVRVPAKSR